MALTENINLKDGITLGTREDLCYKCEKIRKHNDIDSMIPYGDLEYKDVFRINRNGINTCICMKHLKEMIDDSDKYELVDKTKYTIIPTEALDMDDTAEDSEPEEVKTETEKVEEPKEKPADKKEKKTTKKK